jgi:hypothetical protein
VRKAFDELGFVVVGIGEIEELAANRSSGVIVSQASEYLFNATKNHRLVKGKKRFRRPEKQYAAMLAKGVPERVHRFTPIKPDTRADKSAALSQDAFVANEDRCSVPVGDIVSSKQTPDFTTCGAENLCRSIVDLQVMRDLERGAGFQRFDACWLGGMCIWEHNLAMRKVGFEDSWVLPLNHWSDSGIYGWPIKREQFAGYEQFYYVPQRGLRKQHLLSVTNLDEWLAVSFEWRSPAWQFVTVPDAYRVLAPAVRRVSCDPVEPLLKVAARRGFWKLDKAFLTQLAKHKGYVIPAGSNLMDVLLIIIKKVLACGDEEAMGYVKHRLAAADAAKARMCKEILQIEDLDDVMDKQDIKVINQTQATSRAASDEATSFETDYREAAQRIRRAREIAAMPKAKAKAKPKAKAAALPPGPPMKLPIVTDVPQADAKLYVPIGGSIWIDHQDGYWCSHFKPFQRFSAPFKKFGQAEALRLNYVDLWTKWCLINGYSHADCPMKDVLDSVSIVQVVATGAASSSSGAAGP